MTRTTISRDAPEWFTIMNEKKLKDCQEQLYKNEEFITIFSRYQKWITVTPRNKNRKKPLEKEKKVNYYNKEKIRIKWKKHQRLSLNGCK